MGIKDNIESLFSSEDVETSVSSELPRIETPDPGAEKRQFTRIDIEEKKVDVRFNNELQFARQYIENISLGGLFVKTSKKYSMGELVSIDFRVPDPSDPSKEVDFILKAVVCRVAQNGVGLEFTNLTQELRTLLENYVRSVLPSGAEVRPKPKQSSLDRVEKLRQQKLAHQKARKKFLLRVLLASSLIVVNAVMLHESVKEFQSEVEMKDQTIKIGNHTTDLRKIRSIQQNEDGSLWLKHDDEMIPLKNDSKDIHLPEHLRHQIGIVRSISPQKPKRRSKNAAGFINTR